MAPSPTDRNGPPPAVQQTVRELVDLSPVLTRLGERFTAAGFEAHMSNLRRKLVAAGLNSPEIRTVRGVGYRLVA